MTENYQELGITSSQLDAGHFDICSSLSWIFT